MFKIKKQGFTLNEVLAAILIIGVVSILTLPSLTKNIKNRTNMELLKGTVATIENAVQSEITKQRTDDISTTDIVKDPKAFLERFDVAKSGTPFANQYKRYIDSKVILQPTIPSEETSVLLKNGVGIGIINEEANTIVVVDVTGNEKPNMVGVDYFIFKIERKDDYEQGHRAGDIKAYINGGVPGEETEQGLKNLCYNGNGAACFRMVELSGYDSKYID